MTNDKAIGVKSSSSRTPCIVAVVVGLLLVGVGLGVGLGLGLKKSDSTPQATHTVSSEVVLAGSVSDYTSSVQTAMKEKIATEMSVQASDVTLAIVSASVRCTISIAYPSAQAANSGQQTLATKVADTSAAATFLSTPQLPVTVEQIASAPVVAAVADSGGSSGTDSGGTSGGTGSTNSTGSTGGKESPSEPEAIVGIGVVAQISLVTAKDGATNRRELDLGRFGSRRLAVPTGGDYVTDAQSKFIVDITSEYIQTPQMIICMVGAARGDLKVNQGPYLAWSDENQCDQSKRGAASSSNAQQGGDSSPSYVDMAITSTRSSNDSPMFVKGHVKLLTDPSDPDDTIERRVYFWANISASPTADAPNGIFAMEYTMVGYDVSSATEVGKIGRGVLQVSGTSIAFAEKIAFGGHSESRRVFATGDPDTSGSGALAGPDYSSYPPQDIQMQFGFNTDYFCRRQGSGSEYCFNRDESVADASVWRYGLYDDSTGDRYSLSSPSFTIKTPNDDYGHASYHGIHLPPSVTNPNGITVTRADDPSQSYEVVVGSGKLLRNTRSTATLDAITKVPFRFHSQVAVDVGGTTYSAYSEFEAYWDASTAMFALLAQYTCDNTGCGRKQLSATVTAAQLSNFTARKWCDTCPFETPGIWGWSQALGDASLQIEASTLLADTPGSAADGVRYFVQAVVMPGDTDVPTTLSCVQQCATAASIATIDDSSGDTPFTSGTTTGETLLADKVEYTWDTGTYTLADPTSTAVANAGLPADARDKVPHGLRTLLVAPGDVASLVCPDRTDYYCGWQARNQLTTYYEWEIGPQAWHSQSFLKKSDGTFVSFSPPDRPTFVVPQNTAGTLPYGEFAGATMQFHYEGFGELHGIPGKCFSSLTNEEADCAPGTRYVPAFVIPQGADGFVTLAGGTKKWVKWLEKEIRFKRDSTVTSSAQGISFGDVSNLPAEPPLTGSDPNDPYDASSPYYAGTWNSANFAQAPAIIHGLPA